MSIGNVVDTGNLWWGEIAGPVMLVSDIESSLAEGQSVICNVTTSLSFRWTFRDTIGHWLSMQGVTVEHIDCSGLYQGEDITEFLLNQLQSSALTEYRRRRTPQYMRDKGILHGKLLWIRGVDSQYLRSWFQYISSYRSHDLEHGLFFMEVQSAPSIRFPQNLQFFDHDQYIRRDDLRLYASILAENYLDETAEVKEYAVELVSALSVVDGELANELLNRPELISTDPVDVLRQVYLDNYSDSPRGRDAWHPFVTLRTGKQRALTQCVWSAQLRVGFARIEMERVELIRRWYSDLLEALRTPYLNDRTEASCRFVDYEGNLITDPMDLEIGMLLKLASLRRYQDRSQYLFYLPDLEVRARIRLLRDCRNKLAHMEVCAPNAFNALLSGNCDAC